MDGKTILDILTGILLVALAYMVVRDDRAQKAITAIGDLFSGSIKALYGG